MYPQITQTTVLKIVLVLKKVGLVLPYKNTQETFLTCKYFDIIFLLNVCDICEYIKPNTIWLLSHAK